MYAIISHHDKTYEPLAKLTWHENKIPYAERHGYYCDYEEMVPFGHPAQVQKVNHVIKMLNDPRNFEWIWWTGGDLMITNWTIRMEDKVDNDYHMVIATDCNGFNADSILVRNSPESKAYWNMVAERMPSLAMHWEGEQKVIKDTYHLYKDIIKVVPQREINAYNYDIYKGAYTPIDYLNTEGNWEHGDWVIHWPGMSLADRLQLADFYTKQIVK